MEKKEEIPVEKLPFEQFKLLGLEKKDVLALPPSTLKTLLSGNRTSLIQFKNLRLNEILEPVTLNAKLSLQKDGDSFKLIMHPINLEQKNNLDLNSKEIEFLQQDPLNILPKKIVNKDGALIDSFISLDRVTNEFIAVKKDTIKSPESINDIVLSDSQKKDFVNGKPIQIGKDNFQLDINSEQGIAGKNLDKIEFKKGKYSSYNLILDVALFATGLAPLILIEHLAKMIFNNKESINDLLKIDLKPAMDRTVSHIAEKLTNGSEMNNKEKNELFVINVKDSINTQKEKTKLSSAEVKNNPEQIIAENTNAYTYVGNLVEHGKAPYEFKNENKENYFVKLDTAAGEKIIWGQDLNRAIENSKTKVGDRVGINYEGAQAVKVNVDVKDLQGEVIGVKEKTVNRNTWDVKNLSQELKNEIGNKVQVPSTGDENKVKRVEQKDAEPNRGAEYDIKENLSKTTEITSGKDVTMNEPINKATINLTEGTMQVGQKEAKERIRLEMQTPLTPKEGLIDKIKSEIVGEVKTQNKATEITSQDANKINHPEQKESNETKSSLKSDINSQTGTIAKAASVISKDVAEIIQVKTHMKR